MLKHELVPIEIVSCLSEGREPSVEELFRVAERIQADCRGEHSAFSLGRLNDDAYTRLASLRVAHAALCGTG